MPEELRALVVIEVAYGKEGIGSSQLFLHVFVSPGRRQLEKTERLPVLNDKNTGNLSCAV